MADFSLPNAPEYETWQQLTAEQMRQIYLRTVAQLVNQAAAAGHHHQAIQYAQQCLAVDELDETMQARLIGLYTAVGDRTAALRQFERCALALERELGVSPLPETRAALQPMTARPAPIPAAPPSPALELPLVGRDETLNWLGAVVADPAAGLILLSGEPGMGKSRLLQETLAAHGGVTLVGAGHPGGETLPYQPLLQALRPTLQALPGARAPESALWTAVPGHWVVELLPLLPELAAALPALPAPPPAPDPTLAQSRLYEALAQTMAAFAGQTPLLLCLDDLQWADAATLGWLRYLAARPWPAQFAILAACRPQDTSRLDPLRRAFARVGRLAELAVGGLTADDVKLLLSRLTPQPTETICAQIWQATGGNPFFILEIIRDLQESDQLGQPPSDLPLPGSVREAILTRLSALTPLARQLLEAAAVLSPHLDERLLRQTAARSEAETADGLDELLAHRLLGMANGQSSMVNGQWSIAFPHGLLQTAVYQSLTPWRRKLLHRRAGEALAQFQPENAAVLADHFAAGEVWETAVFHYQRAAAQARELYAYEVALAQLNRAFALLPHLPEADAARLALLRQRLALRRALVQLAEWEADAADLLRLGTAVGDAVAQLEALEAQISLHVLQSDFALVEETAAAALALAAQTGDRPAEARIRQTLGWHLADALGRSREGLAQLQMACRLAREVGETAVLYQSLCNLAFAQRAEGQCAAARASAEQALALTAYQPGSPPHPAFADALRELGEANAYLGRWEEARRQLRPLLDLYQTLNDPWAYGAVLYNFGLYSSNMGQHEEAVAALRQLVALSEAVGLPPDSDYGIWHRVGLARALLAADRVAEAGALLQGLHTEKLALGRPYLAWARTMAEYHLQQGEGAAALALLQPAVDWWRQNASLHDADVLLLLAQALLAVGERERAATAVGEAAAHLAPTDIARYHLRLYWTQYQVSGDPTALAAARAELERQAAAFTDSALRRAFLQAVPRHAQIYKS
jgi:predicted ATPase